ncbi:MAG: GtrA family protein [Ruminococcus sp.]|nr:GtrA family protein [Ruminococcus sp.]MCM1380414.1 GtrA family protein [Muribaculaceae bacterium]
MKELIEYIKKLDFKNIFVTETDNTVIQLFRYCFVGGAAFVADWLTVIILTETVMHYLMATAVAFFVGLAVNFALSKLLVFKSDSGKVGKLGEFLVYAVIGAVGLGLTELLMFVFTDALDLHYAVSKIIAAAIVLIWNFFARKVILYKK